MIRLGVGRSRRNAGRLLLALGLADVATCPAAGPDHLRAVSIDYIVAAAGNALVGCDGTGSYAN